MMMEVVPAQALGDPRPGPGPEATTKKKRKKKKKKKVNIPTFPLQGEPPSSSGGQAQTQTAEERGTDGPSWATVVGRRKRTEGEERSRPPPNNPRNQPGGGW